jgi:hypothetical protein
MLKPYIQSKKNIYDAFSTEGIHACTLPHSIYRSVLPPTLPGVPIRLFERGTRREEEGKLVMFTCFIVLYK